MNKYSQFMGIWPQIHQKLSNPPSQLMQGNYPKINKLKSIIPAMNKFKVNPGKLQDNAQAVGHVSTEDADGDGRIDTINLNSPRIEEEFSRINVPINSFTSLSPEQLGQILEPIAGLILHELGHFGGQQFTMIDENNPEVTFKSEQEADQFALQATNISNKFEKTGSFNMTFHQLKVLSNLASDLDDQGAVRAADYVDTLMQKLAQDAGPAAQLYDQVLSGQYGKYPQQLLNGGAVNSLAIGRPDRVDAMKQFKLLMDRGSGQEETRGRDQLMAKLQSVLTAPSPNAMVAETGPELFPSRTEVDVSQKTPAPTSTAPQVSGFTGQTGLPEESVVAIQDKLIELGYDIGSKTGKSDGIWGAMSTKAWQQLLSDYREAMKTDGLTPDKIERRISMLTGGNLERAMFMLKMVDRSPAFAAGKLRRDSEAIAETGVGDPRGAALRRLKVMEPAEREAYRRENPKDYQRLVDYSESLKEDVYNESPLLQELSNQADDSDDVKEETEVKTASTKADCEMIFWSNSSNPFGRSNAKYKG